MNVREACEQRCQCPSNTRIWYTRNCAHGAWYGGFPIGLGATAIAMSHIDITDNACRTIVEGYGRGIGMATQEGIPETFSRSQFDARRWIVSKAFRSHALRLMLVPLLAVTLSSCVSADWQSRLFGKSHGSASPDDGLTA